MKRHPRSNCKNNLCETLAPQGRKVRRTSALLAVSAAGILLADQTASAWPGPQPLPQQVGAIFVIAMENHNFTQPTNQTSPQQIFGNPAAPFINSLITPGNPNAVQVSFATAYCNAGKGVHPSEPNYVWAEAGTDFGVHTDADPRAASGNTFYQQALHLTGQLNAAGISWKNYQEDVELSVSPTNSVHGTNGPVNVFNGSTQFDYAVKHNPMAFFAVTDVQNVYPFSQLFSDLQSEGTARYNWITPDQFNDAHSSLNGGFTYNGVHYTGDAANIAQGDNFLAQIVPMIMASPTYRTNGVIIIWWDESEGGDDASRTIQEIIISPLAKGNAYASSLPLSHSSDIKTVEEILGLPFLNNLIPASETNVLGGYNNVATVNDLSDLFVPGVIPAPAAAATAGDFTLDSTTGHYFQTVTITNPGSDPVPGPLWLMLGNLSGNAALVNADGTSASLPPLASPFVSVPVGGDGALRPHETKQVTLEFLNPSGNPITYSSQVVSVVPTP